MKKLLRYLTPYRKECFLAPFFKALEACFELYVPLVIAQMIDVGIVRKDTGLITRYGILLIILAVTGFISANLAQYFAAKAATGFGASLRHDLFSHLLNLSFSDLDRLGSSTMITRMTSDVNLTQNGVNMVLRLFLRSPFIVTGATVMAFTIHSGIGLLFILLDIVLFLAAILIVRFNIPLLKIVQERLDNLTLKTREAILGSRVIRAFRAQNTQMELFKNDNDNLLNSQKKAGVLSGLLNPITYVIINLFIVILIYFSSLEMNLGNLSGGDTIALYNYMSQILIELVKLATFIITVNKALAGADRVAAVMDITDTEAINEVYPTETDNEYLSFSHVFMRYNTSKEDVLSDISFSIKQGEVLGIIGPTGSGKSTLVSLIPRLYLYRSGNISLSGISLNAYKPEDLLSRIGFVLQKSVLFQGTVRDNLLWGNQNASDEELLQAAELACCKEVIEQHGGLDAQVSREGNNFSGGQKQRLCIARALVKKPELLILDDSFSALDYATDSGLQLNLRNLSWKPTIIIVSQRTVSIAKSDKIIVLDEGKMVGCGTHDELLNSSSVYQEIYHSQN